jgi:hypothetical protein
MNWKVSPVVTDRDRDWALDKCPAWACVDTIDEVFGEIVDDGGWLDATERQERARDTPNWSRFVSYQIERFEEFFAGQTNAREEWSRLWRYGWWPKANPELFFPSMAKKKSEPFFRKGTQEFAIALRLATDDERRMWVRFGVAQFKPDDPRVKKIESATKRKEAAE